MGLFDFIKKKLFGKTKKIEETKKKSEDKSVKKESNVLDKKTTLIEKKPSRLESIKKAIFGETKKVSDKKVSKKKIEKKEVKEKPIKKKVKEDPVVEEIKEDPVVEEVKEDPVVEEIKEEPVVEEVKEEPVVEKVKEEPVVEKVKEDPVVEKVKEEPVVEEVKEDPVVEEVKEDPVVEEVKEKPVAEEEKNALDKGLQKTKKSFFSKLKSAILGKSKVDDEVLDDLEEVLITSDVGVETTIKIIERIEKRVEKDKYTSTEELDEILKDEIVKLLSENTSDLDAFDVPDDQIPYIILVVGVNGVGKTTTIGKLAAQFKAGGLKVLIGAADTFRAAAVDQILKWGERVGVDVVSHGMNTDPASVAFDSVKKAVDENYHVVIIDTAGRLHTKINLMNELSKIKNVIKKFKDDAPHEVLLVLDGGTGQNAFIQAKEFIQATEVNSLAITKLDGTAKGGVVIGITDQFKIPIKYIGVGEKVEDLQLFHKEEFVNSFFEK